MAPGGSVTPKGPGDITGPPGCGHPSVGAVWSVGGRGSGTLPPPPLGIKVKPGGIVKSEASGTTEPPGCGHPSVGAVWSVGGRGSGMLPPPGGFVKVGVWALAERMHIMAMAIIAAAVMFTVAFRLLLKVRMTLGSQNMKKKKRSKLIPIKNKIGNKENALIKVTLFYYSCSSYL